jgi:DNA repair protein RecN (Recombination protein N)
VITGETGAGKSILLGALGLLLGNRADTKSLWNESEKCIIEGLFRLPADALKDVFEAEDLDTQPDTILRREISPQGKSRAFVNDTPVNLDTLRAIGSRLMDVHSQHETLQLGNNLFQLQLVDAFAQNHAAKSAYQQAWHSFRQAKTKWEQVSQQAETLRQEAGFIQFQLNELRQAGLRAGEVEELEARQKILSHAEEIKTRLINARMGLQEGEQSVLPVLHNVRGQLQAIAALAPEYQQLLQRIDSARIELADVAGEIERMEEGVEFDPVRAEETAQRLSAIYQLLHKHRQQQVDGLLAIQEDLQAKANRITSMDDELADARQQLSAATLLVQQQAMTLSDTRKKHIPALEKKMVSLLKELGIPEARVVIDVSPVDASPHGCDFLDIRFTANKGMAPRPLAEVASGGEFARVMFALKYLMAEKRAMPTLVLDEIDTGVSGEIALRLGALMQEMAQRHQVITITHLPQIAARGERHYRVYKDNSSQKTESQVMLLAETDRVEEIAQMIGGARPSALARENARELMAR